MLDWGLIIAIRVSWWLRGFAFIVWCGELDVVKVHSIDRRISRDTCILFETMTYPAIPRLLL